MLLLLPLPPGVLVCRLVLSLSSFSCVFQGVHISHTSEKWQLWQV
jgi:hypothetical protein